MRFAAVHKWSTYLLCGAAVLGLLLSGELDVPTSLLGVVGVLASWWFEPPRVRLERWAGLLTAIALGAFALTLLDLLAGGDKLLAGARFLLALLLVKLFSRRTSRDVMQAYLLAFLVLVVGAAINTGPSYAVCFLAFVIFATWALILHHLRREMEENFLLKHSDDAASEKVEVERILSSRRIVGPAFLVSTSGVSLGIFLGAVFFFVAFPRVGFGLFRAKTRTGVSTAGFSERVQLGGHGTIRDDDTVVMRVYLDRAEWRGVGAPPLYFRGIAFDQYSGGGWKRSEKMKRERGSAAVAGRERTQVYLSLDGHEYDPRRSQRLAREALRQEIYLEPLDTSVLFGASVPIMYRVDNIGVGRWAEIAELHPADEVRINRKGAAIKYEVWSEPAPPDEARLAAAPDADPQRFEAYLQVPEEQLPRVVAEAERVTRGARSQHEKVKAIERYLSPPAFGYTLEQETAEGAEPLEHFLLERKRGHCEYFASAGVVMLRAAGVPARNVNGFMGGEWNEYGDYLAVRGGDAHSWVEVWYEGVGWVTWDPTPPAPMDRGAGWFAKLRRFFDTLKLQWFKWVIEYDLARQVSVFKGVGNKLGLGKGGALSTAKLSAWVKRNKWELATAVFVLAAAGAAWSIWRRRKQPGDGARRAPRRAARDPLVTLFVRTAAFLARKGYARPPAQTPREHAAALQARGAPFAGDFLELTELYYRARFGEAPGDVARGESLAAAIKKAFQS